MSVQKQYRLYDIGSYFIHLYDKIGGNYYCSQVKLEKLILLANTEYYNDFGFNLIKDLETYIDPVCGVLIDTSKTFFRCPITCSKNTNNKPIENIKMVKLKEYKKSIIFNFDENNISDDNIKKYLINIFLKYGSYDAQRLKEVLEYDSIGNDAKDTKDYIEQKEEKQKGLIKRFKSKFKHKDK